MPHRHSVLLVLSTILALQGGCKHNIVSPVITPIDTTWTRCQGLPNLSITGFCSSSGKLVAGSYNALLSQAYIFISVDEGSNWTLDTTFHTKNRSPYTRLIVGTPITFLAKGAYLFAGIAQGDSGNVYVSTDNGVTWIEKDTEFVANVYVFAALGETVFAGTDNGVFRSTDNGISWGAVNTGLIYQVTGKSYPVKGLATVGSNIFACTNGEGIFRSPNNGTTWSEVNTTDFDFQNLASVGTAVFAGAFQAEDPSTGGVFISTDNGDSWLHADAGLGTDHGVNIIYSDGRDLFAGTNASFFVSTNEGTTWRNISNGSPIDSLAVGAISVIDSQLFVGTGYGAWRYSFSQL